jgi:dihydropteroate synthase
MKYLLITNDVIPLEKLSALFAKLSENQFKCYQPSNSSNPISALSNAANTLLTTYQLDLLIDYSEEIDEQLINTVSNTSLSLELLNNYCLLRIDRTKAMLIHNSKAFSTLANSLEQHYQSTALIPKTTPIQWMGILNATPDSFSDGGINNNDKQLRRSTQEMLRSGVHILDIGAQSTRPGAITHSIATEWQRLQPALEVVLDESKQWPLHVDISIDTFIPEIARKAIKAGATIINDVSGLEKPEMRELVSQYPNIGWIAMHQLGLPADKTKNIPTDQDPIEVLNYWAEQLYNTLKQAQHCPQKLYLDPGIGFGKTAAQSLEVLKRFGELKTSPNWQWLIGHSRKSFLNPFISDTNTSSRDAGTIAATLALLDKGCRIFRVHNIEDAIATAKLYLSMK